MSLTREQIRDGQLTRMLRGTDAEHMILSDEARNASLHLMLEEVGADEDVWVFAYGSLIWNPAFHYVERRPAMIEGFHRYFSLLVTAGRGTPDQPGLMLGLEPGGRCPGVAFRVAASERAVELDIVWRREMLTGAYRPTWVDMTFEDESRSRGIAFVINHEHERYAGQLDEDRIVAMLATAKGHLGSCQEYLFNTAEHLEDLGLADPPLLRLRDKVRAYGGAPAA